MDIKGERMVEGNFEAEGKLVQHLKDVELMCWRWATGAPLLATALHRQLLLAGVAGGLGDRDNSAVIAVLRSLIAAPR
jgi:3-hydroxyisobutyrate dehydrogenase-like beta-hydroxyacid dehydrogenase